MSFGARIRTFRKERNLTLAELSQKSGVALATLSRMETDRMRGTVDSHNRICKALNVSLTDLYREIEAEDKVIEPLAKKERAEHLISANKVKMELLVAKTHDKKMLPLMLRIESKGQTQEEKNTPGVEKFLYVISGTIEATIASKKYTLRSGDSLYFDASEAHSFANPAKNDACALFYVSPPSI